MPPDFLSMPKEDILKIKVLSSENKEIHILIRMIKKYRTKSIEWKTHSIMQPPCVFVPSSLNHFSPSQIMSHELLKNITNNVKHMVLQKVIYLHV